MHAGPVAGCEDPEIVVTTPDYQDCREVVADIYSAQIGVRETSTNWSAEIKEYLATTGIKFSAPWCAALVSYCYTNAGVDNPRSAWSPDYFRKDKLIDVRHTQPERADVFAIFFNNLGRIAHVGFVHQWPRDGDYFITVEGNTNGDGSREGDGVYKKRRLKRQAYRVARYIYNEDNCRISRRLTVH